MTSKISGGDYGAIFRSRERTIVLIAVAAALAILAFAATPALANSAHGYERAIGEPCEASKRADHECSEAGQLELVAPYREVGGHDVTSEATKAYYSIAGSGVAVNDENHDVYVADTGNNRISEFGPKGEFVLAWGWGVGGGLGFETCGPGTLSTTCHKGLEGAIPGEFSAPRFVAVDNDLSSPSHGDVYVGEGVGTPEQNEDQFVELNGATGGTFTLTYEGKETSPIPFFTPSGSEEKDAANTRAALEAATGDHEAFEVREVTNHHGEVIALEVRFVGVLKESVTGVLSCNGSGLAPANTNCETNVVNTGSKPSEEAIEKFSPAGVLEEGWGDKGRVDVGSAKDGYLQGIAVAPSGDLWAEDGERVYRFGEAGNELEPPTRVLGFDSAEGIAVNAADELYAADGGYIENGQSFNEVERYQERGGLFYPVGLVSAGYYPGPTSFALDSASDTVYLGLGNALEQGIPAEVFGAPQLQGSAGVAVDSSTGEPPFSGAVYAANTVADTVDVDTLRLAAETSAASDVEVASMTLHGTVDPEGTPVEECTFEYGASEVSGEYEHSVPCEHPDAAELGSGTGEVPVEAKISGLRGGVTYHFRVLARKGSTTVPGNDSHASTPPAPVISGEEATEVTASGARLSALVDPEGLPVTRCEFEYVPAAKYEASAANPYGEGDAVRCEQGLAQIGFGTEPVSVSARIAGLEANVTYHWRLSVRDEHGAAYALDNTFVYPASSPELPDHRAYEMVTPPFKNGASIGTIFQGLSAGIAENGDRVIATSIQCFAGSQSCTVDRDSEEGEPFAFTRIESAQRDSAQLCEPAAPPCWKTTPLTPPSSVFSENNAWLIDPNEGTALFSMPTPPDGENDYYVRETDGSFADVGPVTPPAAGQSKVNPEYMVASAGFTHLVVDETAHEWPFDTPPGTRVIEYYMGAGDSQPFLVGVDTEGKPFEACETVLGAKQTEVGMGPVSADGGTVYFTACPGPNGGQLYARVDGETGEAHTVKISGGEPARFIGASEDGSRAFFTEGGKLFESECTAHCQGSGVEEAEEQRATIDVSAPEAAGESAEVQGVTAVSNDGSHVYFVANGALAPGARRGHCPAAGSSCNLYVYERDTRYPDGHVALVARVPEADYGNIWVPGLISPNVTPDGQFLVFESQGDLTADDTRTDGYTQVFRYDADPSPEEEAAHVPALVRVSIGRDGYDDDGNGGVGDAAIAEPSTKDKPAPERRDPTMSDDGSYVFFQSSVGLTANALNDVQIGTRSTEEPDGSGKIVQFPAYAENVYEWEAPGTVLDGQVACTQASGCVYLISDGRDVSEGTGSEPCYEQIATHEYRESATCLMGTDASGHDVFFYTADQLVPKDTDTQVDIYDARICEPETGNPCVTEPPPPLPPCGGEQCHGIPEATPSLLAPGTATFNGEGNITPAAVPAKGTKPLTRAQKLADALRACRKEKSKKKRAVCEKQAKKKYGVAKKSSKKKGK